MKSVYAFYAFAVSDSIDRFLLVELTTDRESRPRFADKAFFWFPNTRARNSAS